MKKLTLIAFLIGVFSCGAFAEITTLLSDNFDSYANDTKLNGNGRWELNSNWPTGGGTPESWVAASPAGDGMSTSTSYAVPIAAGSLGAGGSVEWSYRTSAAAYLNTDQSHISDGVLTVEFDMACYNMLGSDAFYVNLIEELPGAPDRQQLVGITMSSDIYGYGGKILMEGAALSPVSITTGTDETPSFHIEYTIDLTNRTIDLAWADLEGGVLSGTSGPHSYNTNFSPNIINMNRPMYGGMGIDNLNVELTTDDPPATFLPGDANGDGVVSAGDYAAVQANFGNTLPAATPPVPEPATMLLLGIGGLLSLNRRRRRA